MTRTSIQVHIEELVLHDFPAGARYPIADAVERELVRLFSEQGRPTSLTRAGDVQRLDGGAFEFRSSPTANGALVGQAVYGALNP